MATKGAFLFENKGDASGVALFESHELGDLVAENLIDPDLTLAWRANSLTPNLEIDLGAATPSG